MYKYIKGTIEEIGEDFIVVDNNNIGYKIFTSSNTILNINNDSNEKKLYTYLHVREDQMSIYGFITREELDIFKLLLSVSKIGPKVGLAIVSTMTPSEIKISISTDDIKTLTKAPGVGKKTAKRIILDLKDKIEDNIIVEKSSLSLNNNNFNETISALISLGYTKEEAKRAISKIDTDSNNTEDIIKLALNELSK